MLEGLLFILCFLSDRKCLDLYLACDDITAQGIIGIPWRPNTGGTLFDFLRKYTRKREETCLAPLGVSGQPYIPEASSGVAGRIRTWVQQCQRGPGVGRVT